MKTIICAMAIIFLVLPLAEGNDKVAQLAAAAGVPESQIQAMRVGTGLEVWVDTDGDGCYDTLVVLPGDPSGWGEIAKQLGLHPSVLGNGKGKGK